MARRRFIDQSGRPGAVTIACPCGKRVGVWDLDVQLYSTQAPVDGLWLVPGVRRTPPLGPLMHEDWRQVTCPCGRTWEGRMSHIEDLVRRAKARRARRATLGT
jgi:hypothetical protein